MEELISQLTSIARGMWKFRWPGLAVAWIVAIAGSVVALRVPNQFEASARIFVDTQSILKPLMAGLAVQPNVNQQVAMLSRTLMSRPNIEKLVRMADLDLKSESKTQQDALIEGLMSSVRINSAGRDNLYTLNYVDADKEKAKRVIQSMVSIFVESSLGASRKDTDSAKVFLDEQIKLYEAKLEEAETKLKDFRVRNIDLQVGEGKDSASRLGEINTLLGTAKLELREAENSLEAAKKQMQAERASGGAAAVSSASTAEVMAQVATPEIDARIAAQKRSLDGLLQRFTDAHPDIISARRLIKDLEEQRSREAAELRKAAAASPSQAVAGPGNLLAQEMGRMLAAAELQVAGLKVRVSEYQTRYAAAKEQLKTAPRLEAEAAQLNRDYGVIKSNYNSLVSRRESAVMSGDLDMAAGMVDFRLIDPPRVSPKPVSPNRILLLVAALAVALTAGIATTFAASQLRPVYNDGRELAMKVGLPLLGMVSMLMNDDERKRERAGRFRFYAGTGGLFASFLVAMVTVSILASRQAG